MLYRDDEGENMTLQALISLIIISSFCALNL